MRGTYRAKRAITITDFTRRGSRISRDIRLITQAF